MKAATVLALCLAAASCAHDATALPSTRPTIVPEPHAGTVTPQTSTSGPPPTAALATPPALRVEAPLPAQTAAPAVVATTMRPLPIDGRRSDVTYPVVALDDAAASEALDLHLRAELDRVVSADGRVRGACTATLASATLVSVICDLTTSGGREMPPGQIAGAATFRLAGSRVLRMDPTEAFTAGTRLADVLCAKAIGHPLAGDDTDSCFDRAIALSPTAVVGRVVGYSRGRSIVRRVEIPYTELAGLIRDDGALAWAAASGDAPPSETARLAAPREAGGIALSEPLSPALLVDAFMRAHVALEYSLLSALPTNDGMLRLAASTADTSASELAALTAITHHSEPVVWGEPRVHLSMARATREVVLRTAPNGGAVVRALPPGTYVVVFDGSVVGSDSVRTSVPGLAVLAGATSSATGWASSLDFTDDETRPEVALASANFAGALPAAERDDVMRDVLRIYVTALRGHVDAERIALVGRSATGGSYVGVYGDQRADGTPPTWGPIFFTRVEGAATMVRVFQPSLASESLVAVATRVAGDPAGVERWAFYALGATTPCFTTSLRSASDVSDDERVKVIADDEHGLSVVAPTGTTVYAWNGTTLTPRP